MKLTYLVNYIFSVKPGQKIFCKKTKSWINIIILLFLQIIKFK